MSHLKMNSLLSDFFLEFLGESSFLIITLIALCWVLDIPKSAHTHGLCCIVAHILVEQTNILITII